MGASRIEHNNNECNLICDLNPTPPNNYYSTLDDEEDNKTVVANNKSTGDREYRLPTNEEAIESRGDEETFESPMTKNRGWKRQCFQQHKRHGQKLYK